MSNCVNNFVIKKATFKFVVDDVDDEAAEKTTIELDDDDTMYRIGMLIPCDGRSYEEFVETFYNVTARDIKKLLKKHQEGVLSYVVRMFE